MNLPLRRWADRGFTGLAWGAVGLIAAALVAILLPIALRGGSAVLFQGTAEFRRMQWEHFHRGDAEKLKAELAQTQALKQKAYEIYDRASEGLDITRLEEQAGQIYRQLGPELERRDLSESQVRKARSAAREARDSFLAALQTSDKKEALSLLATAAQKAESNELSGTGAERYAVLCREYRTVVEHTDLTRRAEYARSLESVRVALADLLGPRGGEPVQAVARQQYGATRWDQAQAALAKLLYEEQWRKDGDAKSLCAISVPREQVFAGTELAQLFPYVRDNIAAMLHPQGTIYWQYFLDGGLDGHYFGGVGPEILGTVLLTVLAIAFALPVGVIAAGYLVECAGDTVFTRILRTCVNTLAGVPSIVFGLFGLSFFVLFLLPRVGLGGGESILAGSLTLAILVLPVIIRASEEAIRAVPYSYKEAALSVGASRFRCFVSVTLPAAMPGILTGLILSMSRAAGETAPILFTAGAAAAALPTSILQPTRTLSYSSYNLAVTDPTARLVPHNQFGMVMTLVAIVLLLNVAAIVLRGRLARKLRAL